MNHENEEKVPVFQAVEAEVETDESRPSQPVKLPNPPVSAATDSQGKATLFHDLTIDSIANNFVIGVYCRCQILYQIVFFYKIYSN